MTSPFPYNFIVIEGNIGAGKTTLCNMIAKDFGGRLVLERFTENPFLPFFYENPERYAFPVELFFMTERHKQLQEELIQQTLFEQFIISDYFFLKTLLFAKNNLSEEEYRLFQQLFHILNAPFPKPQLLVYLHRSVPHLLQNIQKRGRAFEKDISPAYLTQIQNTYFEFFKAEQALPILILEIEDVDFQLNKKHYHQLIDALSQQYNPGIQQVKIQ